MEYPEKDFTPQDNLIETPPATTKIKNWFQNINFKKQHVLIAGIVVVLFLSVFLPYRLIAKRSSQKENKTNFQTQPTTSQEKVSKNTIAPTEVSPTTETPAAPAAATTIPADKPTPTATPNPTAISSPTPTPPDSTPPEVTIIDGPGEGAEINNPKVCFTIKLTDNIPDISLRYRYWLDETENNSWKLVREGSGTTIDICHESIDRGWHTMYFQADDIRRNKSEIVSRSFNAKDITPPELSITGGPGEGETIEESAFCFVTHGEDDFPFDSGFRLRYDLDNQGFTDWSVEFAPCFSDLTPGDHTILFQIKDSAGNESAIVTRHFTQAE